MEQKIDIAIYKELMKPASPREESKFCNYSICRRCRGEFCCDNMGCAIDPHDMIEVTEESIMKLLSCGFVGIVKDIDVNEDFIYYLRILNLDSDIICENYSFGCMIKDEENGCPLPFTIRPREARELIPDEDKRRCNPLYVYDNYVEDWLPYRDILEKIYNTLKEEMEG